MKMLCNVRLSPHRYKTPEGYLYCKDAIIARTGSQTYLKSEIYENCDDNDYIEINRSEKEVFDPKTIASFENKPLTIEHPSVSVGPDNYKDLSVGHIQNVRKGMFEGQPVMFADIVVNDAEAISLIESGEMTELSCGYDCDITDGPNPEQINIRGNHVALCEQGRAGIARIQDSWGAKPITDSVGRGTLIQEFGKQGKQYKIQKIVGNVIYARSINEDKLVLFKRDEENIEWATITKSELRDTLPSKLAEKFEQEIKQFVEKLGNIEDVKFEYSSGYIPREHKSWAIVIPYVGNWEELPAGPYDDSAENRALEKLKEEFEKAGYKAFIENNHGHIKVFEKTPVKDAKLFDPEHPDEPYCLRRLKELKKIKLERPLTEEETEEYWYCKSTLESEAMERNYLNGLKPGDEGYEYGDASPAETQSYRPNDFSDEFTYKEIKNFLDRENAKQDTDAITVQGKPSRIRKKKVFVNWPEKEKFYKKMEKIEEADVRADEFDTDPYKDGRYLVYWEVYYYDTPVKDAAPLFVIALSEGSWLDENDRPTTDKGLAKKFASKEDAEAYRKVYCKGTVQAIQDCIHDSFNPKLEAGEIEKLLEGIKHGKIDESYGSLTIDFDDKKELRKAGKKLVSLYDIELFTEDPEGLYIAVYDKFDKPNDIELADSETWFGVNLKKGRPADDFKLYLRDRGFYFEPSENGNMIHFEVKNADEDVKKEVRAIKEHYSKVLDSSLDHSRRFYIKAIKGLKDKLKALEKNELLDSNQEDYQIQKNKMIRTINEQIKAYEKKLAEIDGN